MLRKYPLHDVGADRASSVDSRENSPYHSEHSEGSAIASEQKRILANLEMIVI